jgi:hypothetical protein
MNGAAEGVVWGRFTIHEVLQNAIVCALKCWRGQRHCLAAARCTCVPRQHSWHELGGTGEPVLRSHVKQSPSGGGT